MVGREDWMRKMGVSEEKTIGNRIQKKWGRKLGALQEQWPKNPFCECERRLG